MPVKVPMINSTIMSSISVKPDAESRDPTLSRSVMTSARWGVLHPRDLSLVTKPDYVCLGGVEREGQRIHQPFRVRVAQSVDLSVTVACLLHAGEGVDD